MRLAIQYFVAGFVILTAASVVRAEHNTLSKSEIDEGWILLFDGQTDFGWKAATKANWKVADGVISVSDGQRGLLHTTSQFGDFQLKLDFRSAEGTNSGVFLRTSPKPSDPRSDCYELNIADSDNPFPTGSFVGRKKCEHNLDSRDWQSFDVLAEGGRFTVKVDGQPALDYTDPAPLGRGYIGLQLNSGKVEFRNIKLKPLGLRSIFNGKNLAGWKTFSGAPYKSVFSVTPRGELNVKNGRGGLESVGQYADFILQLEVFSNGKHLNSGVFFRSIPGEFCNGYECQIQNGYKDGDRAKPLDCGTGGFYRRQNARRVVSNDFQWFPITLIATGPHMAAWVNGYPVSDWSDPRDPDPNPRRGKRLEKGTLILQGHDPTTDLSFRNLRIAETPQRGK